MSQPLTWAILPIADDRDPSEVLNLLLHKGIGAEVVLRVPHDQADAAHAILSSLEAPADLTHDLDLETLMRLPEIEAASLRGLLEANGIEVISEPAVGLPNFPTEINVARKDAALARQLIADAQKAAAEDPIS